MVSHYSLYKWFFSGFAPRCASLLLPLWQFQKREQHHTAIANSQPLAGIAKSYTREISILALRFFIVLLSCVPLVRIPAARGTLTSMMRTVVCTSQSLSASQLLSCAFPHRISPLNRYTNSLHRDFYFPGKALFPQPVKPETTTRTSPLAVLFPVLPVLQCAYFHPRLLPVIFTLLVEFWFCCFKLNAQLPTVSAISSFSWSRRLMYCWFFPVHPEAPAQCVALSRTQIGNSLLASLVILNPT